VELIETSNTLKVLNIESNFMSPEMVAKLLRATLATQSLVEFHAENQVPKAILTRKASPKFQRQTVLGNQIEMDIMLSVEDNDSLLRVGVSLQSMEARNRVGEALERNYERRQFPLKIICILIFRFLVRLKRLEEKGKPQEGGKK
jgi:hypothetical protein